MTFSIQSDHGNPQPRLPWSHRWQPAREEPRTLGCLPCPHCPHLPLLMSRGPSGGCHRCDRHQRAATGCWEGRAKPHGKELRQQVQSGPRGSYHVLARGQGSLQSLRPAWGWGVGSPQPPSDVETWGEGELRNPIPRLVADREVPASCSGGGANGIPLGVGAQLLPALLSAKPRVEGSSRLPPAL